MQVYVACLATRMKTVDVAGHCERMHSSKQNGGRQIRTQANLEKRLGSIAVA